MTDASKLQAIQNGYSVASGNVVGSIPIRISGRAVGITSAGGWQDVWGGSGLSSRVLNATVSTDDNIDSIVSTSASDTGKTVAIEGVTIAGVEVPAQTVTLNGQTRVAIPIPLARINRVYGTGQTALVGIVSVFAGAANHTEGVATAAALRAVIALDGSRSDERNLDGSYSVPAGKSLLLTGLFGTNVKTSGTTPINSIRLLKRRGTALELVALVGVNSSTLPAMDLRVDPPVRIDGPADLLLQADASATATVTASAQGILIDS